MQVTYPSLEELIRQPLRKSRVVRLTQRLGRELQCCGLSTVPNSVGHELLNQRWITWRRAAHVYNGLSHTCKQMADGINQDGEASILHGPLLSIFTQRDLKPSSLGLFCIWTAGRHENA